MEHRREVERKQRQQTCDKEVISLRDRTIV